MHVTQQKYNDLEAKFAELSKQTSMNSVQVLEHQIVVDKHHIDRLNDKIEANGNLLANYERIITELNTKESLSAKNFEILKSVIEKALSVKEDNVGELSEKLDEIRNNTAAILTNTNNPSVNSEQLIKYAHVIQCAKCSKFFPTVIFIKHLKECLDKEPNISAFDACELIDDNNFLDILIEQAIVTEDKKSIKSNAAKINYVSFVIKIESKKRSWRVSRRFVDFYQLVIDLKNDAPNLKLPASCYKLIFSFRYFFGNYPDHFCFLNIKVLFDKLIDFVFFEIDKKMLFDPLLLLLHQTLAHTNCYIIYLQYLILQSIEVVVNLI